MSKPVMQIYLASLDLSACYHETKRAKGVLCIAQSPELYDSLLRLAYSLPQENPLPCYLEGGVYETNSANFIPLFTSFSPKDFSKIRDGLVFHIHTPITKRSHFLESKHLTIYRNFEMYRYWNSNPKGES